MALKGEYSNLNAYNLDNNDLDYIVYRKYLLKLAGLEKKKKVDKNDNKSKRPFKRAKTHRRSSMGMTNTVYNRLMKEKSKKKKKKKASKQKPWKNLVDYKVTLTEEDKDKLK